MTINSINESTANIDMTDIFVSLHCDMFAVPLELFELIRQSCPTKPPIWRASLEDKESIISGRAGHETEQNVSMQPLT